MKAYRLADWAIYPETNGIVRGDAMRKLESRVMQMLVYFCENPNRVISRDELMDAIWGTRDLNSGGRGTWGGRGAGQANSAQKLG